MGFLDHLDELRKRIILSCVAIGVGMLIAFLFVDRIAEFVLAPTLRMLPPTTNLIFTRPGELFSLYVDLALIGGVVVAAPFVTYQVWRFIAPGLYAKEKRFVVPFVLLAAWQARRSPEFWAGWMAPVLFGLVMTGLTYGIPRFRLCAEPSMTIIGAASLVSWASAEPRARVTVALAWFAAVCGAALGFAWFVR